SVEEAALSRPRPILLTALASLASIILPLLLAGGSGAAGRASMTSISTVLFYGQLVATVLTLFVVPVVYVEVKMLEGRH
ncbi:hypothetical protein EVJ30_15065, partial [Exiguobacterium sp. SH5S13]|uniref:efflux RND transporter permease subunit n=1 Tax=Exiguobacterium sp. SH5S13 TaxID=2510959 RepID=UPI00103A786E